MTQTKVQLRPAGVALQIPKLYITGFPKSGLHLANRMALGMFQQNNPKKNWLGTNAWTVKHFKLKKLAKQLNKLQPGEFIKGHMGYLPSIEFAMTILGIGVVFVYRDLRDVVVSQYYHVMDDELTEEGTWKLEHPNKQIYWDMKSKEDVMIAIIEGVDEYPGIFDRFGSYVGWLNSEWAMSISYEVMLRNSYLAATKFFDYVYDVALRASEIEGMLDNRSPIKQAAINGIITEMNYQPSSSPTFRKGIIGNWKQEFTPKVLECFKANDPGYLVQLGYEKDDSWQ